MAVTLNASTSTGLVQSADTSGQIELQSNGTTKATVSSSGLAIGQYNPSTSLITSGTTVTASGTSVNFTSIPSWVKRITMMLNGISTSGNDDIMVQLGTGGSPTTSGYLGSYANNYSSSTGGGYGTLSAGFRDGTFDNGAIRRGTYTFILFGSNVWACHATVGRSDGAAVSIISGTITLSGTLDMVRLTTENGSQTFDAGTVNIIYE